MSKTAQVKSAAKKEPEPPSREQLLLGAAVSGDANLIGQIIQEGKVNVEFKDKEGSTPLILAADRGHAQCVRLLLQAGHADLDASNNDGLTAFIAAAYNGETAVIKALIEHTKTKNHRCVIIDARDKNGKTALIVAVQWGFMDIVKLLVAAGASVTKRDNDGLTALDWARDVNETEMIEILEKKDPAEINAETS